MGGATVETESAVRVVYQASDKTSETAGVANIGATFLPQAQEEMLLQEFEDAVGVKFPPLEAVVAIVVSWASLLKFIATSNGPAASRESRRLKTLIRKEMCQWLRDHDLPGDHADYHDSCLAYWNCIKPFWAQRYAEVAPQD